MSNQIKKAASNAMRKIERYAKEINFLRAHIVVVGLPKETVGVYEDGTKVVDVGIIHEYGTAKIPERSWLRMPTERFQSKIMKEMDFSIDAISSGKRTAKQALNRVGMAARNAIMEAFKSGGFGSWPDITEETKEKKGSSGILKDTGLLMQSVTWALRNASER